jgi:hypothetical protein
MQSDPHREEQPLSPDSAAETSMWRPVLVATALAIAVLAILAANRIDLSPARYLHLDLAVRDAFTEAELPWIRYGDPSSYLEWVPSDWYVWSTLHSGHVPFWNRVQGGGFSPVVALYFGVFHPVRWIAAAASQPFMLTAIIVLSLFLAALGAYLYARRSGLDATSALVTALLFSIGPAVMSSAHYSGALLPIAHMPWMFLFLRRYVDGRRGRDFAALCVVTALLFLSGHPSIELVVCAAAALVAMSDAVVRRSGRPVMALIGAGAAGALLATFALLPALLAIRDSWSYKATVEGMTFRPLSLHGWSMAVRAIVSDRLEYVFPDQPSCYAYLGVPALLLVGVGVFAAIRRTRALRHPLLMLLVCFAFAIPGPWMMLLRGIGPATRIAAWYYSGVFGFWVAVVAGNGFSLLWRHSARGRWVAGALGAAALVVFAVRAERILTPDRWRPLVGGNAIAALRAKERQFPLRVTGTAGQVLAANSATITGVEDVRFRGAFFPLRYERWWALVDPDALRHAYGSIRISDRLDSPLVGDFNIAYVLQGRYPVSDVFWSIPDLSLRDRSLSRNLLPPRFPVVLATPSLLIHANRASLVRPRVHFAPSIVRVAGLAAAVELLRRDPHLVERAAVVESDDPLPAMPSAGGSAAVRYPDDAHALVDVRSTTGGLVVLHDAYAAGWTATVDGRSARVMPVNVLSRGVIVGPGAHLIEFTYVPPGFLAGLVISGITAAALAARMFWWKRRSVTTVAARGAGAVV